MKKRLSAGRIDWAGGTTAWVFIMLLIVLIPVISSCRPSLLPVPVLGPTSPPISDTPISDLSSLPTHATENELSQAPAGLIYCSQDALWVVRPGGSSQYLVPDCRPYISPDYHYVLFEDIGEYYIMDLITGEVILDLGLWDSENDPGMQEAEKLQYAIWSDDSREIIFTAGDYTDWPISDIWSIDVQSGLKLNLSDTTERFEGKPSWFDGQESLLFNSYRVDDENIHPRYQGYLTTMNRDGSNYTIVGEEPSFGGIEVSPDGDKAALVGGELYTTESQIYPLSPKITNQEELCEFDLVDPSWSPDCRYLSWSIYCTEPELVYGYGIQDLDQNTIHYHYPYPAINGEYYPLAPKWSPDSTWLHYNSHGPETGQLGLSIIKADGTEEYFFEGVDLAIWDFEASSVVLNTGNFFNLPDQGVLITEVGIWQVSAIDLPSDAIAIDWINSNIVESWNKPDS